MLALRVRMRFGTGVWGGAGRGLKGAAMSWPGVVRFVGGSMKDDCVCGVAGGLRARVLSQARLVAAERSLAERAVDGMSDLRNEVEKPKLQIMVSLCLITRRLIRGSCFLDELWSGVIGDTGGRRRGAQSWSGYTFVPKVKELNLERCLDLSFGLPRGTKTPRWLMPNPSGTLIFKARFSESRRFLRGLPSSS